MGHDRLDQLFARTRRLSPDGLAMVETLVVGLESQSGEIQSGVRPPQSKGESIQSGVKPPQSKDESIQSGVKPPQSKGESIQSGVRPPQSNEMIQSGVRPPQSKRQSFLRHRVPWGRRRWSVAA